MPWQETQFLRMMFRNGPSGSGTCGLVGPPLSWANDGMANKTASAEKITE
jgi:hypothetical protein